MEHWKSSGRCVDLLTSLDQTAIGFFDPLLEGYEDFEEGWQNDVYLTELPTGHVAVAPFGGGTVEDNPPCTGI
jgi:hypothetical protein